MSKHKLTKTSPTMAKKLGDAAAKQLDVWCKTGLPEDYSSFEEALYDWYSDLPWDREGANLAAEHIISSHQEILKLVKKTFKFDMVSDLKSYIEE